MIMFKITRLGAPRTIPLLKSEHITGRSAGTLRAFRIPITFHQVKTRTSAAASCIPRGVP